MRQESARVIAQRVGVSRPTLYNWKNELLGREVPTTMKRHNDSPPAPERTALEGQVESLQRDIQQLQLEYDLLKKANELLKKDLGIDLHLLTNREKTLLVDALRQTYPLSQLFGALGLARSPTFITGHDYKSLRSMPACVMSLPRYSKGITPVTAIAGCERPWLDGIFLSQRKSCGV